MKKKDNSQLINQSRTLLKESALSIINKLEPLLEKDSLNSYIPELLACSYKVLGQWERSRELLEISQKIEEKLKQGSSRQIKPENTTHDTENILHPLLVKAFMEGLFSGLIHPIVFFHHLDGIKNVLNEPKFANRFLKMLGRFCGGFPSACGLVYSVARFYDTPRIFLPLGLSLIATNSASAYRLLNNAIQFNFNDLDDDTLVGFYKAFIGDLEGAHKVFQEKKDRIHTCMIGDFYLDEAESDVKVLKKNGLLNVCLMNVLMKQPLEIYSKAHDPTNIRRIASDYSNLGFTEFAEDSWRKYYELENEKKKNHFIISQSNPKPIYRLTPENRDALIKECERLCRARYKGRSVKVPYSPRRELKLFKALCLMEDWKGERDINYFTLKAQIYRLLGFKKMAESCESAVQSIEINRITIEEKIKTLKKLKDLHAHASPLERLKFKKSMEIRGYLSDNAVDFLNK
jgi:hypothetical protein